MDSAEKDTRNTKNFLQSLNETLQEKEKLINILSSTKNESSLLKSRIESAVEELRKINEEIQDIQIKKKTIIRKQDIRRQKEQKAQNDVFSLCAERRKIKDLIKVEQENSLDERIRQLEECIKYSENHWIFQYFNNGNHEVEAPQEMIEENNSPHHIEDEIILTENEQI
ncbi:unnamed protein product [Schistosoma turkestanicum]|nr:unnamed protein product [Schistosoma turkestanicum]